jgi:UV DNA damage endonuclease
MRLRSLGYVGQNYALGLTTGKTLRLANLANEERLVETIASNLAALETILAWNVARGIRFFRIASSFVPFASHADFALDWRARFAEPLDRIAAFADAEGVRLSLHPGQYTVLNAPSERVVAAAVAELEYSAAVLQRLAPRDGTIVLHVGGAYGDPQAAKARAVEGVTRLSDTARSLLVLEHDDTVFDLDDVLEVAAAAGLPVVFDIHHHRVLHRRADWRDDLPELLERVVSTWGERVPKVHVSSARSPGEKAHADHVADDDLDVALALLAEVGGDRPVDVMLEAKAKEGAVLHHLARLTVGREGERTEARAP